MNLNRLLSILFFALLPIVMSAKGEDLCLRILKKDGSKINFALSKFPVISFSGEKLLVKYQDKEEMFNNNDIVSASYCRDENLLPTDMEDNLQSVSFTYHDNGFSFYTFDPAQIIITGMNGHIFMAENLPKETLKYFDYSDFVTGIYILKCGKYTYKFIVR